MIKPNFYSEEKNLQRNNWRAKNGSGKSIRESKTKQERKKWQDKRENFEI